MRHAIWPMLAVALAVFGIFFSVLGFRYLTAETRGEVGAKERVESADHRLASYEKFYDLCAEVKKARATLTEQEAILAGLSRGDRGYMRQRRNVAAIRAQVSRLAADYNADAAKEETAGKFRAADLPVQINPNQKGPISCGN